MPLNFCTYLVLLWRLSWALAPAGAPELNLAAIQTLRCRKSPDRPHLSRVESQQGDGCCSMHPVPLIMGVIHAEHRPRQLHRGNMLGTASERRPGRAPDCSVPLCLRIRWLNLVSSTQILNGCHWEPPLESDDLTTPKWIGKRWAIWKTVRRASLRRSSAPISLPNAHWSCRWKQRSMPWARHHVALLPNVAATPFNRYPLTRRSQ